MLHTSSAVVTGSEYLHPSAIKLTSIRRKATHQRTHNEVNGYM